MLLYRHCMQALSLPQCSEFRIPSIPVTYLNLSTAEVPQMAMRITLFDGEYSMKKFTFTVSRTWLPILAVLALAFVFSQFSIEANAITVADSSAVDCCEPCDPADCPMPCDPSDCPPGRCAVGGSADVVQASVVSNSGCESACVKVASTECAQCPSSCTRIADAVETSGVAQLN